MQTDLRTFQVSAICNLKGVGPVTGRKILELVPHELNPQGKEWVDFICNDLPKVPRFKPDAKEITRAVDKALRIEEVSSELGITTIGREHPHFPKSLLPLADCPLLLFAKGNLAVNNKQSVAIVGARSASYRSLDVGKKMATKASELGYNVVSGLALGCDTSAHVGSLDAGGTTTAVLAHGLDIIFPPENEPLAERILENDGVLLSEYPVGVEPRRNQFIARNRIQAGLSVAVIVIEATSDGGTMKTVAFAEKYSRMIGCWDNPDPQATGNRLLISDNSAERITTPGELERMLGLASELNQAKGEFKQGELW